MTTSVDVGELRRAATLGVLRREITRRGPCPAERGRCPCKRPRGLLHCPLPGHRDSTPSCSTNPRDGAALWHCHGCGSGGDLVTLLELAEGLSRGDALRSAAALVNARAIPGDPERRGRYRRQPEPTPSTKATKATAAAAWSAAVPVEGTPAALYLAGRRAWPARSAPGDELARWIDAEALRRSHEALRLPVPGAISGALLWPLRAPLADPDGDVSALGVEGLADDGRRAGPDPRPGGPRGRWRCTIGPASAGAWAAHMPADEPPELPAAYVLEGPLDALALLRAATLARTLGVTHLDAPPDTTAGWARLVADTAAHAVLVVAAGGTARLPHAAAAAATRAPTVVIVSDRDPNGRRAAGEAAAEARLCGAASWPLSPWAEQGPEDMAAACAAWPQLQLLTDTGRQETTP